MNFISELCVIFEIKYKDIDFTNIKLFNSFIKVIKILYNLIKGNISMNEKYIDYIKEKYNYLLENNPKFVLYTFITLTNFIKFNDIDNEIINVYFNFQILNNNINNFMELYLNEMKRRCINNYISIDVEKYIYNILKKIPNIKKYNKEIKIYIHDFVKNKKVNNDLKNINIKNKNYIGIDYNMNLFNTLICSKSLWKIKNDKYNNINIPKELEIYYTILKKYFLTKFKNSNRVLTINNSYSFLIINLNKCQIKLPVLDYLILDLISKNNTDLKILSKLINISLDDINQIITKFKNNNIILSNLKINESLGDTFKCINLIKNIKKKQINKNILKFNKFNLIDCFTIKVIKKYNDVIGLSYNIFFETTKNILKHRILLEKHDFDKRLKKLLIKNYIKLEEDKYFYVI